MLPINLRKQIAAERMKAGVARRFGEELERLAQIDGYGFDPDEAMLITRLVQEEPGEQVEPAPFEALWEHGELFLTACLYVAVSDGRYSVEQSRHLSVIANRLGWSTRQIASLEDMVLEELRSRGLEPLRVGA